MLQICSSKKPGGILAGTLWEASRQETIVRRVNATPPLPSPRTGILGNALKQIPKSVDRPRSASAEDLTHEKAFANRAKRQSIIKSSPPRPLTTSRRSSSVSPTTHIPDPSNYRQGILGAELEKRRRVGSINWHGKETKFDPEVFASKRHAESIKNQDKFGHMKHDVKDETTKSSRSPSRSSMIAMDGSTKDLKKQGSRQSLLREDSRITGGIKPKNASLKSVNIDMEDLLSDEDEMTGPANSEITIARSAAINLSLQVLQFGEKENWAEVERIITHHPNRKFDQVDDKGRSLFYFIALNGPVKLIDKASTHYRDGLLFYTSNKENLVHAAAQKNDSAMIRFLLLHKVSIHLTTVDKGYRPIHYAVQRIDANAFGVIDVLLKFDSDALTIPDILGNLPIHLAIKSGGNITTLSRLLTTNQKVQMESLDEEGNSVLHLSAARSSDLFKYLSSQEIIPDINLQNKNGETAFHFAVRGGDENILKFLYKLKASANICDNQDKSVLHVAAELGHTAIVEKLIDKFDSSLTARTKDGDTLLHIAACSGHSSTALAFLKRGVPLNMPNKKGALGLHTAAAAGFNEVVKVLLNKGTNIDIKTKENYTALHIAVQANRPQVVETLLGYGANVHLHGGVLGETPLHVACNFNDESATETALMLLKSGCQPNVRMNDGQTCLHVAAKQGIEKMIKLLLDEEADPLLLSNNGETVLHIASKYCNYKACSIIIEHVSKLLINEKDALKSFINSLTVDEGKSALHYASEITSDQPHFPSEDADIIKLLIDHGANSELQTTMAGETCMHGVCKTGNKSVILAIVDSLDVGQIQIIQNKQSKKGWAPLLEACARGNTDVALILLEHNARIDVFDEFGKTSLHLAAANGHLELVESLLKNKAFVNSKSKDGATPLHCSAMAGHTHVVYSLITKYGAAVEAVTLDLRTPLHSAALYGQLGATQTLLACQANPNARDDKGQTPLHLAAEENHAHVVKLFLKMKQNKQVLTAVDSNGFTCAHIAAMKGSLGVVKELMLIDKNMVLNAKTKSLDATTLHMACGGGHNDIVKLLLDNGANPEEENSHGMTPLSVGAMRGKDSILEVFDKSLWKKCSKKTGLNALHVAAYYGNIEFVNSMLMHISANQRSEPPLYNHLVVKEFATEYGFTPLHLASQSGHEGLVRMLLNQNIQVDAASTTMNITPLHLASQQGHVAVVGMLLSRLTTQQTNKDWRGRTALQLSAMSGHYEMVSLLIAQGSNINGMDQLGITGLHSAARAGYLNVVKLFIESSADPLAETKEGKVPVCFAAANNHLDVLKYLLRQKHDTHALMEDKKFIFDLMVCGKSTDNEPLQLFILESPAPIDTAVKLSSLFRDMSEKEKERAKDLLNVSIFAEEMAVELLSITAAEYNPAILLKAKDHRGRPLLDVLIENEQKEVVSYASVQRYLTEIWTGRVNWSFGKTFAFTLMVFLFPPAWFYFSLPLETRIGKAPIIKFVCHIVSHVYFTILLTIVVLNITHKIYETTSVMPNVVEWILLVWLSGNLVSELSNVGGSSGLGIVKVLILILSAAAIAVHILAFLLPAVYYTHLDNDEKLHFARTLLYLKNQLFAFALLLSFVQFLDFLTVHHQFGPWSIIIRDLIYDLTRFLVILMLFIAGFTLHVTSIFQPAYQPIDDDSAEFMRLSSPLQTLEMLFFSLFGLVEPDSMPPLHLVPDFAKIILKLLFGIYMMVTLIVLINLLIAMMSDTYQRIQAQSDKEWKFGRAILIRKMNKKAATPSPINMLTKFYIVMKIAYRHKMRICTPKAQLDLRYEENIDAFSMTEGGRTSPTLKDENGQAEEDGRNDNSYSIESVVDWKRIVQIYYQTTVKGRVFDEANNIQNAE
uniref:ANK_REP_REGION domain-containing protein n=1 Tax=Rhabditophanes sp. KR3021 TaxID=114890 RepID=A0AC35TT07_9BILA